MGQILREIARLVGGRPDLYFRDRAGWVFPSDVRADGDTLPCGMSVVPYIPYTAIRFGMQSQPNVSIQIRTPIRRRVRAGSRCFPAGRG